MRAFIPSYIMQKDNILNLMKGGDDMKSFIIDFMLLLLLILIVSKF